PLIPAAAADSGGAPLTRPPPLTRRRSADPADAPLTRRRPGRPGRPGRLADRSPPGADRAGAADRAA
ncbi:MAG TPA: hypothetical protein VK162_07370, partial [Streptosporangiaceae bacterium]|nr:hypothetical protein [Streptosporangiaceae bacterium]